MLRIPVDFNTSRKENGQETVRINTVFDSEFLPLLHVGERVIFFTDNDFEVEAVLGFNVERKGWYGIPDWSTLHYLTDED